MFGECKIFMSEEMTPHSQITVRILLKNSQNDSSRNVILPKKKVQIWLDAT